jgi:hypothetical protein
MSELFQEVQQMLSVATVELFDCYGASVTPTSDDSAPTLESSVMATIGFATEDGSRGNLVLVSTRELIAVVQPPDGDSHTDEVVCDILGELSNMLLGRLKNALLPRGVTLMLGTPTTAIALKLWLSAPLTPSGWLAFDVGGHVFHVRFSASFSDSFELLDEVENEAPALAEGEMILF